MRPRIEQGEMEIREGTPDDVPALLAFIREMAAFERLEVTASEDLLRETLFGKNPAAKFILAFVGNEPVAYATYFFSFSSMQGKRGLWLEDLFVSERFRGRRMGTALLAHLAGIALAQGCGRFEWTVLDWNAPAIGLYEKLGARVLKEWRICRVEASSLVSLASRSPRAEGRAGA